MARKRIRLMRTLVAPIVLVFSSWTLARTTGTAAAQSSPSSSASSSGAGPKSTSTMTTGTHSRPWWDGDRAVPWTLVDPNWSWDRRQTGIRPEWTSYFGVWKHYNESALTSSALLLSGNHPEHDKNDDEEKEEDSHDETQIKMIPWTQGRMCKFLRQVNQSSFELCSVYEPCALGLWMGGATQLPQRADGLHVNRYTFHQTPFRVTELAFVKLHVPLEPSLPLLWTDRDRIQARQSRATVVQPHAATYSGPRWWPTRAQHEALRRPSSTASGDGNPDVVPPPASVHFHFCEMWLAEPVVGRDRDAKDADSNGATTNPTQDEEVILEGRKMGLFCQYDTLTGKLTQVFRMREVLVPESVVRKTLTPEEALCLDGIETQLLTWPAWSSRDHLEGSSSSSSLAADVVNRRKSLSEIIRQRKWSSYQARVVKTSPDNVQEEQACEIHESMADKDDDGDVDSPRYHYYSPAEEHPNDYFDCRFDDGVYARIPKTMLPRTLGDDDDDDDDDRELCLEMGCITQTGDLHRLMATGSRSAGGLHCLVYEKWMH